MAEGTDDKVDMPDQRWDIPDQEAKRDINQGNTNNQQQNGGQRHSGPGDNVSTHGAPFIKAEIVIIQQNRESDFLPSITYAASQTFEQNMPVSSDGDLAQLPTVTQIPQSSFNPPLHTLGGAVPVDSPFYVEREGDVCARQTIGQQGCILRIKGGKQSGKTSLMLRLAQYARDNGIPVVFINFDEFDADQFSDLNQLLLALAYRIIDELELGIDLKMIWQSPLGPKDKLTKFVRKNLLAPAQTSVLLLLDRVDRVFDFANYRDDFFSLIRAWHNRGANDDAWARLKLVLGYSTEARLFITNLHQSPFNVGVEIDMRDFTIAEVRRLNQLHGEPLTSEVQVQRVYNLLEGHPYLTRKLLSDLRQQPKTVDTYLDHAADDLGPFNDHLKGCLMNLPDDMKETLKTSLLHNHCDNEQHFYRLIAAGLIRGDDQTKLRPRCQLYAQFFAKHL